MVRLGYSAKASGFHIFWISSLTFRWQIWWSWWWWWGATSPEVLVTLVPKLFAVLGKSTDLGPTNILFWWPLTSLNLTFPLDNLGFLCYKYHKYICQTWTSNYKSYKYIWQTLVLYYKYYQYICQTWTSKYKYHKYICITWALNYKYYKYICKTLGRVLFDK